MNHRQNPFLELDQRQELLEQVEVPNELFIPRVQVFFPLVRWIFSQTLFRLHFLDATCPQASASLSRFFLERDAAILLHEHIHFIVWAVMDLLTHMFWHLRLFECFLLLLSLLVDLSKYIILQRVCDVVGVGEIETL